MKEKYIEDLKEIKDIMNRSSRFISLSGLSGISAGFCALIGAFLAYNTVYQNQNYLGYRKVIITSDSISTLLLIAIGTIVVAIGSVIYFTTRETKKRNQKIWDYQTKRLLINLSIPLVTGGILALMFLYKGYIGVVAPLTLVFYGLALVNASKYTLDEIRSLGIIEICLGLIAMQFIGYGLIFWAIGFGVLHIVYGVIMQLKNKS
ncbi:hypothetical protein [Fulvivirga lutea]|uniref:Uncharacterized protein n=1 Tax=Fulvivirga lutea TaxID=2810512 RepID=A0A974WMQ8_9BACT|nr:hypothetical protein [Fulvivirga lutea]QSE99125.1 hypothetical protein JR347_08565 [Fulvivirga lutea]